MSVQSFIKVIRFPRTIAELRECLDREGCLSIRHVVEESASVWPISNWAMEGDIVFFHLDRREIFRLKRLENQARKGCPEDYPDKERLISELQSVRLACSIYRDTIFAYGEVWDTYNPEVNQSPKSQLTNFEVLAMIGNYRLIDSPINLRKHFGIDRDTMNSIFTPIPSETFQNICNIILDDNILYRLIDERQNNILVDSNNNDDSLEPIESYDSIYRLERHVKGFDIDDLLSELSDHPRIYPDSECFHDRTRLGSMDFAILLNKKITFVEIISEGQYDQSQLEAHLSRCHYTTHVILDLGKGATQDEIEQDHTIYINRDNMHVFNNKTLEHSHVVLLKDVQTREEANDVRTKLLNIMSPG